MKLSIRRAELWVGVSIGLVAGYAVGQTSSTESEPSVPSLQVAELETSLPKDTPPKAHRRPAPSMGQSAAEQTSPGSMSKNESPSQNNADDDAAQGFGGAGEQAAQADDGDRLTYPDDLDVDYRDEERMARRITEALADAELEGDVRAVDCSEFPCIVFGAFETSDASAGSGASYRALEKLKRAAEARYDDNGVIHSYLEIPARGEQPAQVFFSLTPLPDDLSRAHRRAAIERQDERNLAYFQSATPRPSAGE